MLLRAEAPAKINRELRVGPLRPDGYHDILSRFVSIDLADRIEVETAGSLDLACFGEAIPTGESNLVVRAARALAARLDRNPDARIRLEKRVPIGAGLGGGSADAAITLRLLARLWDARIREDDLRAIAAQLGSDVPYFLVGGEADVSGRGERVIAREEEADTDLLLLIPPFSLLTRDVYRAFDRLSRAPSLPESLQVATSSNFFGPNDLASAVLATRQDMRDYLRSAREAAAEVGITGSGSAIVLRGATREAEGGLRARHPESKLERVRTLGREEYRLRTTSLGGSSWTSLR